MAVEKEKIKIVKNLLKIPNLTAQQIAEAAKVSVAFVEEVREGME